MIPNYIRPQLTIEQLLEQTADASLDRLTAVVIGRQYALSRYGEEDNVYGVTFTSAGFTGGTTAGIPLNIYNGTTEAFEALDTTAYSVTAGDVSVYAVSTEAEVFSSTASAVLGRGYWSVKSASQPNVLVMSASAGKFTSSTTGDVYSGFGGRSLQAGDIFYVKGTSAETERRRVVTAVTAQEATLSGPIVSSAFTTNVSLTMSTTAAGATAFQLSSTAGLTGNMAVVSISSTGSVITTGSYLTTISGSTVGVSSGVTGSVGATIVFQNILDSLVMAAPYTGLLPASQWDFDSTNDQVTVVASAEVVVPENSIETPLRTGKGKLYPSYKALKEVATTEGLVLIDSVSDIETYLGTIDMDNELAFGASECLSGANGKKIYALRTEGDNTTEYAKALRKIEATDGVYAICPLTTSTTVQEAVASHCASMSAKDVKNFRRCYVGTDSPGEYAVLTRAADDSKFLADITVAGSFISLDVTTNTTESDLTTRGLEEGDLVKIINSNGDYTGAEYVIDQVTDDNTVLLSTGPVSTTVNLYVEFWRADSPDSQADYVASISTALANRRAVNVWVENGTRIIDGVVTTIPNKYVAAEIAGLRTAVLPQQGLTMTEIQSVTDAPAMYTRYTNTELDRVAAAGTFVITQEAESGAVFIRHQITTKTDAGSLYYEDSVGVSLDDISFKIKDAIGGFVGKKNVTEQTLREIYSTCWAIFNTATTADVSSAYGPQLNGFKNKAGEEGKLDVTVHPTLKDRVNVYAKLSMPLPLNNLDVILDATVDLSL